MAFETTRRPVATPARPAAPDIIWVWYELVAGAVVAAIPEGFDRSFTALPSERTLWFPAILAGVTHPLDSVPSVFWGSEYRVDALYLKYFVREGVSLVTS